MSIDLDSVPPCPVCGGTLTEHDAREPESLEGWWGHYDCACGWVLPYQHQRLTYWTIGRWGRTLAQEVARLRANAEAREGVLRRREDALRRAERERDEARREERAAVVEWLNGWTGCRACMGDGLADAIERGVHIPKRPRPTDPAAWICMDCGERAITDMSAHDRVCPGAAYKLEVGDE